MAGRRRIHDKPLYVICGKHSIRYPAVQFNCPECNGKHGWQANRHHDDPYPVTIIQ